jgi:anti-sigma factor RsiW
MSSLLQQLENNEAILLMYQAGELPEADRREVEQMLAGDPALRMELAEIASMHDLMAAALGEADPSSQASRREAAVRQVSRAVAAANLGAPRKLQPAAQSSRSRTRIAPWAYPIAAAAMLVIGVMIFSDNPPKTVAVLQPDSSTNLPAPPQGPVEIIPALATDDPLSKIENGLLSLRSSSGELDLFGDGPPEIDH